jgi:hypothetical protein
VFLHRHRCQQNRPALEAQQKNRESVFFSHQALGSRPPTIKKKQILGVVEVDESFFGTARIRGRLDPAKGDGGRLNSLFSAFMSAMVWSTPNWPQTAQPKRFNLS